MFSGSADTKERIRESIDIVDVIGASIELRRQGRNFVGLCPWHQDSRPSLQVNQERQSWKCWVCDVGGDVFSFVMQREGFGFREALEMLAERAGITLERSPVNRAEPGSPNDKNTLYKAMAWAAKAYHRCLLEAADAAAGRKYLAERDIRETSIQQFQIGFVPNQWNWLVGQAERASFSPEVLESVGLAVKSERTGRWYDRFRGRIMFPICDTQRRPIAVGGRILPEFAEEKSAKYINSPETRLFSKSEQLYGLDLARDAVAKQNEVIVMEGYTDVVMARQSGIEHAVAVLGTALGQRHIPLLKRFTDRIALVLDGDTAGQRRANEILDLFIANQVDLRIVTLPDQLDPCDYVNQHGADAMLQTVATAPDAWEHKIQKEIGGVDLLRDTHGANRALETLIGTFAMTPTINQSGSSAQLLREQQILSRLAREFGLEEHQLRQRLAAARRQQAEKRAVRFDSAENSPKPATPKPRLEPMERDLFELGFDATVRSRQRI